MTRVAGRPSEDGFARPRVWFFAPGITAAIAAVAAMAESEALVQRRRHAPRRDDRAHGASAVQGEPRRDIPGHEVVHPIQLERAEPGVKTAQ